MTHFPKVVLFFDGACRNNPRGPAGCGWVLYEMLSGGRRGERLASNNRSFGRFICSHQAEYRGLIEGLQYVRDNINCSTVEARGDSEGVIKQMQGRCQVRSSNIKPVRREAQDIVNYLEGRNITVNYRHIGRNKNKEADRLASKACH